MVLKRELVKKEVTDEDNNFRRKAMKEKQIENKKELRNEEENAKLYPIYVLQYSYIRSYGRRKERKSEINKLQQQQQLIT